jgi:hypothetical protein
MYFYDKTITLLPRSSRREDISFLPEMLVPVLVLVVAPTQRPNSTEARPGHGDQLPRIRRPLAGRPDSAPPPPRTAPSMILGTVPPSGLNHSTVLTNCIEQVLEGKAGPDTPRRVSGRTLGALKPRGLSTLEGLSKTCLRAHAFSVSN